jgi:hypothetical protein
MLTLTHTTRQLLYNAICPPRHLQWGVRHPLSSVPDFNSVKDPHIDMLDTAQLCAFVELVEDREAYDELTTDRHCCPVTGRSSAKPRHLHFA